MRAALLIACVAGCAAPAQEGVSLVVQASGIPARPGTLHAMILLGGVPAKEVPSFDIAARGGARELSLLLRLPSGSAGPAQVALGVKDLDGCLVASGVTDLFVDGPKAAVKVSLVTASPQPPPCQAADLPVLTSASPRRLATIDDGTITLRGFGFHPQATIAIAGQPARGVTWISPLQMTALPPRAKGGPADVEVTNPDGRRAERKGLLTYHLTNLRFKEQRVATPGRTYSGAVADVNGDGWPDLLWTDSVTARLYVRMNRNGAFPEDAIIGFSATRQFASLVVGDLNGDGRADAVVGTEIEDKINGEQDKVRVLLGQGDGTFQMGSTLIVPGHPDFLAIADMDGDGLPDVVTTARVLGPAFFTYVLPNEGGGRFTQAGALQYPVIGGFNSRGLAVADFDRDGRNDIAVVSNTAGFSAERGLQLFFNQGFGQEQPPFLPVGLVLGIDPNSTRTNPFDLLATDIDGDGRFDLLLNFETPRLATVLRNEGGGVFAKDLGVAYPGEGGVSISGLGDFDDDGLPDLVLPSLAGSGVHVLLNRGDGTYPASLPKAFATVGGVAGVRAAQAADLDRDGRLDLVVFSASTNALSVLMNDSE